ncbi:Venom allergen 5, partial [Operophtera brumata]
MWASSYTVGCGRSRFMIHGRGRFRSVERLVCNLSPAGPVPYRALWDPAVPAASCPPQSLPDQAYIALCDYQFEMDESVVVKNKMTIQEHILVNSVLEIDRNESINGLGSLEELYLTNLAIVTMNDIESSTLYNSIKKREAFDVKNNNVNVTDKHIELKTTRKAPDHMSPKISKKKLSTIGRPKTYNMEELNEIEDDHKENNYKITEDALKKFNDIYGDYNIVETQDENETTVTEAPRIEQMTDFIENGQTVDIRKNTINNNNNNFRKETINTSIFTTVAVVSYITETKYIAANGTGLNVLTQTSFANADIRETLKPKEKSIDDYLTDPDTMQQLEHTLDRMEHKMQRSRITA